ncbi:hypothetical protein LZ480_06060 [Solibacillus sp. MA9]|uniref:HEAT repeat domain-containing protein n=1 Tax=Solibacillus palustris TaxID=2908203 RepID=A0ABS9UAV0_9BACL|nr:hypothetical protein [Solibacillus sp. MA9]MCH7321454.1 hypothetical protein [Solibacillus sp. MA9]
MGFKEELKREMRNATKDVAKEVEKHWVLDFEGHKIEFINKMLEETLLVDGEIIAQHTRQSIWSHIVPYSKLKGTFVGNDGKTHKVYVKVGGFIKLNVTIKVDGKKLLAETQKLTMIPWKNKQAIVPFLQQQFAEHGKLVNKELPDDEYLYDENQMRLAPGFADQLANEPVLLSYPKKLVKLLITQSEKPTEANRKATYEKIQEEKVISYFQEFFVQFAESEKDETLVQKEALWLLEHAADREVVKFALVVLGTTDCKNLKEQLKVIALHEEFTGVALFALSNGVRNANDDIWDIAKKVSNWGKIEALNFLEPEREEIRHWFLTDGIEDIVPGVQASLQCADKGKLDIELHEDTISDAIFDGASKLILAMLYDGPYREMDEYDYAGQVLMRYTKHAKTHCETLHHFYTLTQIADHLIEDEDVWNERFEYNWKPHEKLAVETGIEEIGRDMKWLEEAQTMLVDQPDNQDALAIVNYYKK